MSPWDQLTILHRGHLFVMAMTSKVTKQFGKLDAKHRAAFIETMRIYAAEGADNLPSKSFVFEERLAVGDRKATSVAIYAFKEWQKRIYGAQLTHGGRKYFVCSETDMSKKQDRADRATLERAARNLKQLLEEK